ncbi:MAG: hypothetical protein H6744_14640 [Deltaproteobacteria bacterium]|nr:hypothetical protein [Deltaproteobacteria bacterium]
MRHRQDLPGGHLQVRATSAALLALLLPLGCSDSSGAADAGGHDADSGIVILGDLGPSVDASDAQAQPDLPAACPSKCAKEFPNVPTCMKTTWDVKNCTCSLHPADDGTPCDDGLACTASDSCQAGECVGGGPAELVEPDGGWQPEGTPLLEPNDPAWEWASVDVDPSCKACDGSRAYLQWLHTGVHNNSPYSAAVTLAGELVTLEVTPHLRAYGMALGLAWDAPGTGQDGLVTTRRLRAAADGGFYAAGWIQYPPSATPPATWLARYDPHGAILSEVTLLKHWWGDDVLPDDGGGLYVLEGGGDSPSPLIYSMALQRMNGNGESIWRREIPDIRQAARAPSRMAPVRSGGAVVAYLADESQVDLGSGATDAAAVVWARRFDASGETLWARRLGLEAHTSEMSNVAALPADRFVVASGQWPTFGAWDRYPASVWILDSDGETLAARDIQPRIGDYFLIQAVTAAPDGGAILAGELIRYSGDFAKPLFLTDLEFWGADGFLVKVDRWGNYEWMRLYGSLDVDFLWDVIATADGSINAVGAWRADSFPKVHDWILRTDFWGRTCGMRLGVCADMAWQDCEDGNPCTINWCDPDQGCTHPPLPDGSPCDIGKTCQGAICK